MCKLTSSSWAIMCFPSVLASEIQMYMETKPVYSIGLFL
jgi:hypothetical protein